jgi:hypothetical protein
MVGGSKNDETITCSLEVMEPSKAKFNPILLFLIQSCILTTKHPSANDIFETMGKLWI